MASALFLSLNAATFHRTVLAGNKKGKSLLRPFPARRLSGARLLVTNFGNWILFSVPLEGSLYLCMKIEGHLSCRMLKERGCIKCKPLVCNCIPRAIWLLV